jgi:hypothetical protein
VNLVVALRAGRRLSTPIGHFEKQSSWTMESGQIDIMRDRFPHGLPEEAA